MLVVKKQIEVKLTQKKIDKLVEAAYTRSCSGVQIDIMDISKVFRAGAVAVREGKRDAELDKAVRAFVDTIAKGSDALRSA